MSLNDLQGRTYRVSKQVPTKITLKHIWILSNTIRLHSNVWNTFKFRILSRFGYFRILSNTFKHYQVLSITFKYFKLLSNTFNYFRILSNIVGYFQILSNTRRFSNDLKSYGLKGSPNWALETWNIFPVNAQNYKSTIWDQFSGLSMKFILQPFHPSSRHCWSPQICDRRNDRMQNSVS